MIRFHTFSKHLSGLAINIQPEDETKTGPL